MARLSACTCWMEETHMDVTVRLLRYLCWSGQGYCCVLRLGLEVTFSGFETSTVRNILIQPQLWIYCYTRYL